MAIIKCPECGEPVSSTTNKCIHCGYEFSVCPECGTINKGKIAICQNCGYALKNSASQYSFDQSSVGKLNIEDHIDDNLRTMFFAENHVAKTIKKSRNFVMLIGLILGTFLLIYGLFDLINWKPSVSLTDILSQSNGSDIFNEVVSLLDWGMIILVFILLYDWFSMYGLIYWFGRWIKNREIDYASYLRYNANKSLLDKTVIEYNEAARASCLIYSKKMQSSVIIRLIIIAALLTFGTVFTINGIHTNVQLVITDKLKNFMSSNSNTQLNLDYTSFIIGAIIYGIFLIVKYIFNGAYEVKINKWINSVLAKND